MPINTRSRCDQFECGFDRSKQCFRLLEPQVGRDEGNKVTIFATIRLGNLGVRRHRGQATLGTQKWVALLSEMGSASIRQCAGLHYGEIEVRGKDIGGFAVHAAARVMAHSEGNEVLVSRVVTDLVAGTGLKFSDRGSYELKGLPGKWDLFAASN